MKSKLLKLVCIALVFVMLSCTFSSCSIIESFLNGEEDERISSLEEQLENANDPKEKADILSQLSDEKMGAVKSYKCTQTMTMEMYIEGVKAIGTGIGTKISTGIGTDDYCYYEESTLTTSVPAYDVNTKQESIEAYENGNMYAWNKQSQGTVVDYEQKIYAQTSLADFLKYEEEQNDGFNFDINDCSTVICNENDDGGWSITYKGYSAKTVKIIVNEFGAADMGAELIDAVISIELDKDYNIIKTGFEFVFDVEDGATQAPKFVAEMVYSDFDTATKKSFDTTDYEKVDSIIILEQITKKLEAVNEGTNSFKLDIEQIQVYNGETKTSTETDNVTYGMENGKFFYDIDSVTNGYDVKIKYRNGTATTTVNDQTSTASQTEDYAMQFIGSLINSSYYDSSRVTGVTKKSNNAYELVIANPDQSALAGASESLGAEPYSVTQKMEITISDGEITVVESTLIANYRVNLNSYSITVNTKVELGK